MTDINKLDIIVLSHNRPQDGLEAGDVGTVVHLYRDGAALEVEFVTGEGSTVAVLTLEPEDVRLMEQHDILHVRRLAA